MKTINPIRRSKPSSPPISLKWSGWTDRGKVRPLNEDAFLGLRFNNDEVHRLGKIGAAPIDKMIYAFAVSDGMGGAKAGEFASSIAVEKITTLLPPLLQNADNNSQARFADTIAKLFHQIHHALVYVGGSYDECIGMETTLSLCCFIPGWMFFGHIGDSRIYHFPARAKKLVQLSQDDTYVGWLLRNKQITEYEARTHPRRNVLQKALGGGNQFVDPQIGIVACNPGDIFLLCTDGLVEGLHDERLAEHLRSPEIAGPETHIAHQLVDASVKNDGRDNTTALVIQVLECFKK
ncbi:MAG TPA: protein phosphatase 2C domain-containing protein [Verrucomicrobiae bacterium]|jgi:protein phosphatase